MVGGGPIRDFERSVNLQNQVGMRDPEDPTHRLAQVIWHTRYGFAQGTQQIERWGLEGNDFFIQNFGNYRTQGLEGGLEWREAQHGGFLNFSSTRPDAGSDPFFLSADRSQPLAISPVKLNLGAYFRFGDLE